MKRKLYSFLLSGIMMLAGQAAWADLQQNESGAYLIGSKSDLQAWSEMSGYESSDVVLTGDIEGLDFMLCTNAASYSGTFDGAGHTVTLNYDFQGKQTGMFYNFAGTVKNLVVGGSIRASFKNCAALAAWNWSDNATFENVVSIVNIDVDYDANASNAGFIGYASRNATFRNCISAIKVQGNQGYNHGFVGWVTGGKSISYTNCISIAEVETMNTFSWGNPADRASFTNCYCLQQDADAATAPGGCTYVTYDMVASGELCFKANGDQTSINWYQTLGTDAFPVPFDTHKQVYAVGEVNCAGVAIGDVTYSNTNSSPAPKHNDVDGWCSVCGTLMQDHITPNADGFLELGSVADVEWFAAMVNDAHQVTIKGMLTSDIDYQGTVNAHTPIGLNTTYKYNGTFDGQGHRIKGMVIDGTSNFQGFFGVIRGGTVIRNLIIDSSCSVTGPSGIGGITGAAQVDAETPLIIENCVNEATITATSGSASGILGVGQSGYPTIQLKNCLNTGAITGAPATAFCAWINKGGSSITNCVNLGTITGADMAGNKFDYYCQLIRYEPGTMAVTNCFDFTDFDDQGAGHQGTDGDWLTDEPLSSGELCFTLNGDQSTLTWSQRLGTDAYPVPYYIDGGQVYAGGQLNCDGTPIDVNGYSNSPSGTIPPHEYEDGFCINCGSGNPDYAPLVDDFRMISNASQLYWFSRMVNEFGNSGWNARLTDDINMMDYSDLFEPIGNGTNPYRGHFDGQQHRISELHINADANYVGFIGRCGNGALIENLLLDETCSINAYGECVALVGGTNQMAGNVTLRNLGNMGNVYATGVQAAGIFGGNTGSQTTLLIENCFSTGAIEGGSDAGALVGWGGSGGKATINNCWSCSEVTGYSEGKGLYFARVTDGHLSNNYCTSEVEQQVALISYDEIMDGSLCYKLNGDQSTIAWYQNLDNGAAVDDQPLPFSNGHAQVFPKGKMLCDGTVDPSGMTYSNNDEVVIPAHKFADGFCSVCGQEDPNYTGFLAIIKNANFTNDSNFWTGNEFAVSNGVAEQAGKTFDTHQDIVDLENGVYKLRLQGFSRAAALDSEAYDNFVEDMMRNTYYYAESAGKRQARRLVDITADGKDAKMNDGAGEVQLSNGQFVPSNTAAAAVYMAKGHYWNKPLYLAVTDGTLRIGLSNQINTANAWSVIDRVRIEYVGNDASAYALIAQQIADDAQDLEEVMGQESLKEAYSNIVEGAESLTETSAILDAADQASRLPDQIKLSVAAYESYAAAVGAIIDEWESRDDLQGDDADKLETYLTEEVAPSADFPNGTYLYIMNTRLLNAEQLAAETTFAQQLLQTAILNSAAEGSDLTSLIVNPKFDNAEAWNGWTVTEGRTESGYNMVHNGGFTDVFPVAAAYNMAFEVSQEITGLSDGIYALTAQAFHRPGQGHEGLIDGTDVIPAQLFVNDFQTPVLSVYADKVSYADAENGVNCRYDATDDETAPHNGEQTGSVDIDTEEGDGYFVPDNIYTASFAFNGKRYEQTAYGIVKGGKLTIGIRNGETPWRNKNLTIWGNFRLTYLGESSNAINSILDQYSERVDLIDQQRYDQEYYLSQSHIDAIRSKIAQARTADTEQQLKLIEEMNAEFAAVPASVDVYKRLFEIALFASDMADGLEPGNQQDEMIEVYNELEGIVINGTLTDEDAEQKIAELMTNPAIGGVVYVQGDLYDENSENSEWPYAQMCPLYPLKMNAQGQFVGTVTLQDRSRRIGGYQRAGLYFRRINTIYKSTDGTRSFITPGRHRFDVQEGGSDFQALNGTYNVVLDLDKMTVDFALQDEYNWDNAVFVTGTLNNRQGASMRWKNDEQVPLQHVGSGKYVGVVDLVNDNSNPFCSFGIMTCRSTEEMVNYSQTTRGSWTEARYGSEEQYLELQSGQEVTDLVRGLDRTWRISPAGKYLIEFDMDKASMKATLLDTKGNGTESNPFQIANKFDLQSLRDRMADGKTTYAKLTADIDMQGEGWWPINSTFYANSYEEGYGKAISLDGTGHIIMNLTVPANKDNEFETGLFGALAGTVKSLGLYNVSVDGGNAQNAGILAGQLGTEENPANVSESYVNGQLTAAGAAGAIAGNAVQATVANVYANANVSGDGLIGDFIGVGSEGLTVINSYSAGRFNKSQATAAFGDENGTSTQNFLYFGIQNQEEICDIASKWQGWHENGVIGNGWPLLQWQVERDDYALLCGFGTPGDANGDGAVDVADATYILNLMADDSYSISGDVNKDGEVDVADYTYVLNLMADQE
ncbi:MAG: dockerin type I repeat-containing protein [Bacteroidaceae bacterium]|nr:dockerin type I repeat-containing protein [Bacteroidaceae bacterium]